MKSIAIDGPAGSGKSTVAKEVAKKLGFMYVDTGAIYRTFALFVIRSKVDCTDETTVEEKLKDAIISVKYIDGIQHMFLNEEDVTDLIRTEEAGNVASKTSSFKAVRKALFNIQRDIVNTSNIVMDGRDIGTVIIPEADLKVFLTASVEARAKRRYKQLIEKGENPDIEKIKEDIIIRDELDSTREASPLKKAEDAFYLDSSDIDKDEVVDIIIGLFKEK